MTSLEALPPSAIDAEEAVVASVLVDQDAADNLLPQLKPSAFFRESNGAIWGAAQAVWQRGERPVQITVAYELSQRGQLEGIGGQTYIAELIRSLPTAIGAEYYANLVRDTAHRRWLISTAAQLQAAAADTGRDIEEIAAEFIGRLSRGGLEAIRPAFRHISEIADEAREHIDSWIEAPATMRGIPSGFDELDHLLSGLTEGAITMILADTGVGKSMVVTNVALNVAKDGNGVLMFTTEMIDTQTYLRELYIEAGVNHLHARNRGFVHADESNAVGAADARLRELPIYMGDGQLAIERVTTSVRKAVLVHGVRLVIIDHIDDIKPPKGRKYSNRAEEIEAVMKEVKDMARDLRVHVLFVSHINRDSAKNGITLHSAIGGGEKERRSDNGLILNPVQFVAGDWISIDRIQAAANRARGELHVSCHIAKSRDGYEGEVMLRQDWRHGGRISAVPR